MTPVISNLNSIAYTLFSGNNSEATTPASFHNATYTYWKSFWENVFKANGCPDHMVNAEDFHRQSVIGVIHRRDEIVAVHLYSLFNLNLASSIAHKYFTSNFDESFAANLSENGMTRVMSMEYLTVNPDWRKSQTNGVSLALTIASLGCRVQQSLAVDASVGPCRVDVGVPKMIRSLGGQTYGESNLHNTPVEFMAIQTTKIKQTEDLMVNGLVDRLWAERTDYTQKTLTRQKSIAA